MSYQVIKTIKGRQYLYEQSTYRENGKVKTISKFIGAVNPVTRKLSSSPTPQNQLAETSQKINDVIRELPDVQEATPPTELLTLHIQTNLKTHKIGQTALEREYTLFTQHLQNRGLKAKQIPSLSIVQGSTITFKKTSSGYLVSLPNKQQPGSRAKFWRTFRKATSHSYLDAIAKQDPNYFSGLQSNLKTAYKKQNQAISAYIMHSRRSEIFKIGLTLHFLYSKMVSTWTQKHLPPHKIGLSDYSNRSTWQNDTAILMAEIQKEGWFTCYKKYINELSKVENFQFAQLKKYRSAKFLELLSGKKQQLKKEVLKINAKRRAIFATCDKIMILAPLFDGYKNQHVEGEFFHDSNWRITRKNWRKYFQKK